MYLHYKACMLLDLVQNHTIPLHTINMYLNHQPHLPSHTFHCSSCGSFQLRMLQCSTEIFLHYIKCNLPSQILSGIVPADITNNCLNLSQTQFDSFQGYIKYKKHLIIVQTIFAMYQEGKMCNVWCLALSDRFHLSKTSRSKPLLQPGIFRPRSTSN